MRDENTRKVPAHLLGRRPGVSTGTAWGQARRLPGWGGMEMRVRITEPQRVQCPWLRTLRTDDGHVRDHVSQEHRSTLLGSACSHQPVPRTPGTVQRSSLAGAAASPTCV